MNHKCNKDIQRWGQFKTPERAPKPQIDQHFSSDGAQMNAQVRGLWLQAVGFKKQKPHLPNIL